MKPTRRILPLAAFFCSLQGALAAAGGTSVEIFVDRETKAHRELNLTVPAGTNTLRFHVKPKSLLARYQLEGIDDGWIQLSEPMFVRIIFFSKQEDPIRTDSFPVSGRSEGWQNTIKDSTFSPRMERVTVPPGAVSMAITMTTAGPASLVGIYAIRDMVVTLMLKTGGASKVLMSDSRFPEGPRGGGGTSPAPISRWQAGSSLVIRRICLRSL